MANVARLDTKMRHEFVQDFFAKHPRATLNEANDELKKRFTRGMGGKSLKRLKERALAHLAAQKHGTRPLGHGEGIAEEAEVVALVQELKKTTEALAAVMSSKKCPVFQITLVRDPVSGRVAVTQSQRRTVIETETY